jgi:prepilin-type N-terminal cleavage/methylation domain-containing protein
MLMNHKKMRESGFTLLEIIITMVIVAIMATMLFTYSGSKSFTGSVDPIQSVKSANSIHQIMEMITADYQGYPRWKPGTAYAAGSRVTPIKRDGYFYQPPAAGCPGTGEAEPPWPWPPPVTCSPSPCTVTDAHGCIWTRPISATPPNPIMLNGLATLRQKIAGGVLNISGENTTVDYNGQVSNGMRYTIISNHFINPDSSWDADTGSLTGNYLKVTIQATNGNEKLTAIFTQ